MIKDIKYAFKLFPYCAGCKGNIIGGIAFWILGLVLEIMSKGGNGIGLFFFLMSPMFPIQAFQSLNVSDCVASSNLRRRFQLEVPAVFMTFCSLINWTIVWIIRYFDYQNADRAFNTSIMEYDVILKGDVIDIMLACTLFLVIIEFYMALAYKFFWASFVVFMVSYMMIYSWSMFRGYSHAENGMVSFPVAVIVGYLMVFLAGIIYYLTARVLYKYPMDKKSQGRVLQKMMK